jgi:hypothetical protein
VGAVPQRLDPPSPIQQSIARIQEACQAPPLAPQEYRVLFEIMAKEINANDLLGVETLSRITQQVQERGLDLRRDDVRFILEVVSEADPWFEQGASADLFASRFRTFVVARCRGQGLNLSADELHLIDAWFLGTGAAQRQGRGTMRPTPALSAPQGAVSAPQALPGEARDGRWWVGGDNALGKGGAREAPFGDGPGADQPEESPRALRSRMHG